jgi:hypothetical protein
VSSSGIYTSLKLKQARHKAQKVTQSTKHEEAKKPTGIKEGFDPNENSDASSNGKISSILLFLYLTKKENDTPGKVTMENRNALPNAAAKNLNSLLFF